MLKSFINTFTKSRSSSSSTPISTIRTIKPIKIYHNSNSLHSQYLFNKVNNFNSILNLNVETNSKLSKDDYDFIINECLSIHPDNKSIMLQLFNSNLNFDKLKLLKSFDLHDSIYDYNNLSKNTNENSPLIIDYNHNLIANDEKSIDRILVHYLTCGIQSTTNTTPPHFIADKKKTQFDLVHPHVAEFADLF
ncbi:hypothetical protein SBY92_004741 [Candida maltosa Xu316]